MLEVKLTHEQLEAAMVLAEKLRTMPPEFSFHEWNSTSFVAEIARAAGVEIRPEVFGKMADPENRAMGLRKPKKKKKIDADDGDEGDEGDEETTEAKAPAEAAPVTPEVKPVAPEAKPPAATVKPGT